MASALMRVLLFSLMAVVASADDPFAVRPPQVASEPAGQPAASKKASAGEPTVPLEREIVALVGQLVSPNKEPEIDIAHWSAKPPQGFDEAAQDRVFKAWRKLRDIGLPAFPHLQSRLGDKRYCFTQDDGPGYYNFSVGEACKRIIVSHLQPYVMQANPGGDIDTLRQWRGSPHPANYFRHHDLALREPFDRWWRTHKDKSMREVQIEVLEWTIAQDKPEANTAEQIKHLNEILTTLRSSNKPLPPSWPFAK